MPPIARRARGQREYIRTLSRDLELAALQPRTQRAILAAARVLMRAASWIDRTTRPTRARICAIAGISVSTWKRVRRWLEARGYLGLVRAGWTPVLRASPLVDPDTPNEAAVYVLCVPRRRGRENGRRPPAVPAQRVTGPLTCSRSEHVLSPARELPRTSRGDDGSPWFVVAYLRSQVAELRRGPGKTLTDRAVLAIARPFLAERWSPADLAHAIGHDPVTGKAHRTTVSGVRQPASWLAWRLTRWCRDPGQAWKGWHTCGRWDHDAWPEPGPSPAERVTAAAAADRAAAAEVVDRRPGAGPSAEYLATRARLSRR